MAHTICVVIVDDQALVRSGLRMLLSTQPDISVVGEAADGQEALAVVAKEQPDVVLMDLRMPKLDGQSATARIIAANETADRLTRVLVMTTFDDDEALYGALRAGASGYLLKHSSPGEVADAVRHLAGGDSWIDPRVTGRVFAAIREGQVDRSGHQALATLTPREREVLRLVGEGLSNADIRARLFLSEATVKTHVTRILMKTGSRDRAAAVALAYRSGFMAGG